MYCLPDVRATCRTVPGLTKEQLELCYRASDVTSAALDGLELAIKECQYQVGISVISHDSCSNNFFILYSFDGTVGTAHH